MWTWIVLECSCCGWIPTTASPISSSASMSGESRHENASTSQHHHHHHQQHQHPHSQNAGGRLWCYQPDTNRPRWLNRWYQSSQSTAWKVLYIFFSLFLLFGPPIQALTVDRAGDIVFEVLRNMMLVFFVSDMVLKCLTEKEYFECACGHGKEANGATAAAATVGAEGKDLGIVSCCSFGSFLFWCDLISTFAILFDLSYINPNQIGVREIDIGVRNGRPVSGFDIYNRLKPVDLEFNLLVVIARTARCARFVQARVVVGASNKVNWFWIPNQLRWLNPFYCYDRCFRKQKRTNVPSLGVAPNDHGGNFASGAGEDKKSSWGALQIGILAAVHAQAEAEAGEAKEEAKKQGAFGSLWNQTKKTVRSMGLMSKDKRMTARHEAAIKIQRAWRNHMQFESSNDDGFGDLVLTSDLEDPSPFTASTRSNYVNPLDGRVIRKRSALATFSQLNAHAGGRLNTADIRASSGDSDGGAPESRFQSQTGNGRESQVGSDMRELTGQRVAIGVLFPLLCTVLFTYVEPNTTRPTTMVVLHEQTQFVQYQSHALAVAVNTSIPDLFKYQPANEDVPIEVPESGIDGNSLKARNTLKISVSGEAGTSIGWFDYSSDTRQAAWVDIVATFVIIVIWFFGATAFSGPVMLLVITPIERMVRLLGMLMVDPLGYQSTARFKKFLLEEESLIKNTRWTKEVLKGMETSFLMSTILRIGSLMKVGFGTAGVEIIRNNLEKGQGKNLLILNSQGSTVSCIFLFCDIRQFTDATEQLQEEVFVFTNRIAGVVHSICHSYNGAANKNVGDAFLLSWSLEDGPSNKPVQPSKSTLKSNGGTKLKARSNQADKALLSVIKICISLQYDKYYLEPLSDAATSRLKSKLKNRVGPVVQMGFGLHAGKAVQGAIGSQRKIDATYVSEAVERAEFLEASTKKYDLQMLMSGSFHKLLHPNTRRRCRMIDKIFLLDEDVDADEDDDELHGEQMELYTFDMDVEAIHRPTGKSIKKFGDNETLSDGASAVGETSLRARRKGGERRSHGSARQVRNRRRNSSLRPVHPGVMSEDFILAGSNLPISDTNVLGSPSMGQASVSSVPSNDDANNNHNYLGPPELVLPTGPALYSHNVWQSPDMKRIRDKYVQGLFFQKFHAGLQAYYNKDWDTAHICFQIVLDGFDDGPSKYFMAQMKRHNGVPPKDFLPYTVV